MAIDLTTSLTLPSSVSLPNRLAKSALSEGLGDRDQAPTPNLIRLYERWSQSGAGLLITGNVMVDRRALGEVGNVAVEDDRHLEALSKWAAAATAGNAQAWVQLNHPGRQAPRALNREAVAPSKVAVTGAPGVFGTPRELTSPEIEEVVARFAASARLVVDAGFTGVQIHAAHGYLLSQFLSPLTNKRTDAWGGTPQKRRRLLLEIVRATRAELGVHTPISVKLNSADFQRGGMTEDESVEVVLDLAAAGVDLLEISGGNYESTAFMGAADQVRESTRAREAYFLDYAERVGAAITAAHANLPLMVTGGFRSTAGMSEALHGGAVDVIGLGRPLIMEPDLPHRLLTGTADRALAVAPRPLRIKHLEGMGELLWYGVQLRRLGEGKNPDPKRHPLRNLPHYLKNAGMLGRSQQRGFAA
ncbi:NADH oxidoreductase [Nocardia neocaledoniensis NBRC 108232]|uniref:2,4-dienoyl-CoA reductase-like NADH-dependent reductase (Old Yellow Enzyme family) n=1 Tax=Nocardia neocaledoniensis TaxID=236511 RepID=A0A317N7S1_9NOCA|nr:NADH:flavin oxidoreductase/NADH oxidase family protein [Nocardia neocaledoniensis]PWV71032.1 2,4-dienoyl-CoA reductase-like NADH-dependent reductase (Old Yellow Enzyme family) [Nocardia neocaledoniensis]GEM30302.1 NADH oxidoreductase [Nocardia neocaledoniensis NBRC 108232]